jgi:hypothetical protein
MKRTGFTLAVALIALVGLLSASHLLSPVHAQSDGSGERQMRKHRLHQDSDDDVDAAADDPSGFSRSSRETNKQRPGAAPTQGGTTNTTAILYHNGPVMRTPVVYVIWYGNWNQTNGSDTPAGQQIVRDFLQNVGGSPYFLINTSYSTGPYNVTGSVIWGGERADAYSKGTSLTDANIQTIVNSAIGPGTLPYDANGVYFVLTSSDVNARSGFCTQYCGWHTAGNPSAGHIRYSFVGNAKRCLTSCASQSTVSPNGNPGVDGMLSVVAHELEETVSDPDLNAWYDASGAENADKCAWTFGHFQYQVANGSWANMHLGTRDYLIQRNLFHNLNGSGKDYCMVDAVHN